MCCSWLAANTGRKKVARNRHLVLYCFDLLQNNSDVLTTLTMLLMMLINNTDVCSHPSI